MTVEMTRHGFIQLIGPDGTLISQHNQIEEAVERGTEHFQENDYDDEDYRIVYPERTMRIRRIVQVQPPPDVIPPPPPPAPTITGTTSSSITVHAGSSSVPDHSHFNLWMSTNNVVYSLVGIIGDNADRVVGSLLAGTPYWFRLVDVDDAGNKSDPGANVNQSTDSPGFSIPAITFIDDAGDQTHDLRQYYVGDIPGGEIVTNIVLTAGALPTGVTIDVANEELDFTDAVGGVASEAGLEIDVTTTSVDLATFDLTDTLLVANAPVTIGIPIQEGFLQPAEDLIVTKADDTTIPTQWNPLATWRTDGSTLHGMATFLTPDAGDNSGTYKIKRTLTLGAPVVTKAQIVASGYDAVVTAVIGGTTYSLSAQDLLDGTVTPTQDHTHFDGSICSSYVVGGHLRINGTGAEHASLQAHFENRGYNTGASVDTVHGICTLENTGCFNAISTVTSADVTVTVGGSTIKSLTSFRIGADYRFTADGWFGTDPAITSRLDTTYVQDTKLVPKYAAVTLDESMLAGFASDPEWFSNDMGVSTALDSGGFDQMIAPLNHFEAAYLASGDERAYQAMRGWNRQMQWMRLCLITGTSAEFCMNPRDENTGLPLNMIDNPTAIHIDRGYSPGAGIMEAKGDTAGVGVGYQNKSDNQHMPSGYFTEYLLTGEYHLLESMQFMASGMWTNEKPGGTSRTWPRDFYTGVPRAIGWSFRHALSAANSTPDTHPLKTFYDDAIGVCIDSWITGAMPLDIGGNTGFFLTNGGGNAIIYVADQTPDPDDVGNNPFADPPETTGIAPWMDYWQTWAIGSAYERGWQTEMDVNGFWAWKAQSAVKMMGGQNSGHCWHRGVPFAISMRKDGISPYSPLYTDFADIWSNNFPGDGSCPPFVGNEFGNGMARLQSYSGWILPALAIAASTGITDAVEAFDNWQLTDKSTWQFGPEIDVEFWFDKR